MGAVIKTTSLAELGEIRQTLRERAREAAAEAARRKAEAQRQRRELELFARAVGPVHPLKDRGLAPIQRPRPLPLPIQRELDEQQVLRESLSDEMDVESLLDTDEALSFRRRGISPEVVRRLRRGDWTIQAEVDLHGLRRDEAREQLGAFLRESVRQGWRCVRVIHGKGNGSPGREPVLKVKVRAWLVQKSEVLAFTRARASDGGNGALVLLLQASQPGRPLRATTD